MLLLGLNNTKPQLYSCKLFCHIGLETYISVHSSVILGKKICLYLPLSVQPTILFTVSYACAILLSFWKYKFVFFTLNKCTLNKYVFLVQVVTLTTTKIIAVASYFLK